MNEQTALRALEMYKIVLSCTNNRRALENQMFQNLEALKAMLIYDSPEEFDLNQLFYLSTKKRMKQLGCDTERYDRKFYSLLLQKIKIDYGAN